MKKNTGIPYEQFTQMIFQQIVDQDFVNTIKIEHNISLEGKSTSHQIDVFWKFEKGGITYNTIVQTKDWRNSVKQGELLKFKAILEDLPNQPRGIFVTRTGYQQGAKDIAELNGIILYELREVRDEDLEGFVKKIIINLYSFIPRSENIKFIPDNNWIIVERKRRGIADDEKLEIEIADFDNNIYLYNDKDEEIDTIYNIISSLYPSGFEELKSTQTKKDFSEPTFLHTNHIKFPNLKVNSLELKISKSKDVKTINIGGENVAVFILKNVLKDEFRLFDKENTLIK